MRILHYLDNCISNNLLLEQKTSQRRDDLAKNLSGSILGSPLQTQILHVLGVPAVTHDPYTLRKFQRGHHVEAWIMGMMEGLLSSDEIIEFAKEKGAFDGVDGQGQAVIQYRGAKGHIDGLVNMAAWDEPDLGVVVHEVKSVKNSQWKYIKDFKGPSWSHKLQAGMYALALGLPHYVINYVAADDYRIHSYLLDTEDIQPEIDKIIDEVEAHLASGILPEFVGREDWQTKDNENGKDYQSYPTWTDLSEKELMKKLKKEQPAAYERLLSFAKREGVKK